MSKKLGVYVCTGCGIGECLNAEKLTAIAAVPQRAAVVRTSKAFCLEDARIIANDIDSKLVDSVVIAACSPRVNTDVFRFDSAFVERVNLREQVVWSHPPNQDETQALAADHLRMGLARAQRATAPAPYQEANERTLLVIGGGTAGLAAAKGAAEAGFDVLLVEKSAQLGGFARRLYKQFPQRPPYRDLQAPEIESSVQFLQSLPNVRILLSAEIESISGQPGRFSVVIRRQGAREQMMVGAIVSATGWVPAIPQTLASYGLGKFANVVTSTRLEEMALSRSLLRPSDGRPVKRAALILSDGPGDTAHMPYGGNVSSLVALKQALYVREQNPDAIVYVLYRNMQTPGPHEYFYKRAQEDPGILFLRCEIQSVIEQANHDLSLEAAHTAVGGSVRADVDLLVVSEDMVPAASVAQPSGTLNLVYLQGKDLPATQFGFADSNFICFPYETRRTGIYSAGAARQAMDLASSARDGAAAALKAIQSIEKSSAGAAVHPRSGDLTYPKFFMQKCTSCGRCTQECPFGALEVDEKSRPVLDPNRCRRCGICMGACPVQIISFDDYSVDILAAMIKSVEIPDDGEKPRILLLACENDAYPALDMAGILRLQYAASVRVIPVRCMGSVNSILIADAVSRGFDGVALMGCKSGEDYQCHFIRGSELLATRMQNVRETLDRLALEAERVRVMEVAISDAHKIPALIEDFAQTIQRVGPNPMKGFE
jgi:quinone-modifying oxidoreductase subunit QmoB